MRRTFRVICLQLFRFVLLQLVWGIILWKSAENIIGSTPCERFELFTIRFKHSYTITYNIINVFSDNFIRLYYIHHQIVSFVCVIS